jgi:hypothetical protein
MQKQKICSVLVMLLVSFAAYAQCSMFRAVLETESTQTAAESINDGIMYLMIFPYLLMGGVAYFLWRSFSKNEKSAS